MQSECWLFVCARAAAVSNLQSSGDQNWALCMLRRKERKAKQTDSLNSMAPCHQKAPRAEQGSARASLEAESHFSILFKGLASKCRDGRHLTRKRANRAFTQARSRHLVS